MTKRGLLLQDLIQDMRIGVRSLLRARLDADNHLDRRYALTHLAASLLYGVAATDALTFAVASCLLFSAALVACAFPAWRAMRVQPAVALRRD